MKLSLLIALIGVSLFGYGWFTNPPELSLIELLNMETARQEAYHQASTTATILQLTGCALLGLGLVSFIIIRSAKNHKKH